MQIYERKDNEGYYLSIEKDGDGFGFLFDLIRNFKLKYNEPITVKMCLHRRIWSDIVIIKKENKK